MIKQWHSKSIYHNSDTNSIHRFTFWLLVFFSFFCFFLVFCSCVFSVSLSASSSKDGRDDESDSLFFSSTLAFSCKQYNIKSFYVIKIQTILANIIVCAKGTKFKSSPSSLLSDESLPLSTLSDELSEWESLSPSLGETVFP